MRLLALALLALGSLSAAAQTITLIDPFPDLPTFSSPVGLHHADDGTNLLYVIEQDGVIKVFENDPEVTFVSSFLDIEGPVSSGGEGGLLGLAFHPDYATNGYFFVDYTVGSPFRTRISRFTRSAANPLQADPASEMVLLEVNQPFGNHNAGSIVFGPDGYLYVTMGDGGSGGDPQNHGQRPTTLLGSILRLDVDGGGQPLDCGSGTGMATIPSDNPLADGSGGMCDEIYAYGLRNPWRMTLDPPTGEFWIGDVGQSAREEIDVLEAGANYGWNMYEGTSCFNSPCNPAGITFPVYEYNRSVGSSITGGYVYRGDAIPELQGQYVYGDLDGPIWSLDLSGPSPVNTPIDDDVSAGQFCVSPGFYCLAAFGTDQDDELYVLTVGDPIRKLVRTPPTATEDGPSTQLPALMLTGANPAQSSTTLRLRAEGPATLVLFDVLGRRVATLFDGTLRSETTETVTVQTKGLAPGVYVARLETATAVESLTLSVAR